jgi:hypothetical protein
MKINLFPESLLFFNNIILLEKAGRMEKQHCYTNIQER